MFGCIADSIEAHERDVRERPLEGLVGGVFDDVPETGDLTQYLDRVLDQGLTSSCVAHWFSSALLLAGRGQMPRPSIRWAYDLARYARTPGVLVDAGSVARLMCEASSRHGIVAESRFPFDASKIDEPPPFDLDIAGADALFSAYYKPSGDLSTLLRVAIAQGHCPGLALHVYDNFIGWDGAGVYEDVDGEWRGDHMITIVGYKPGAFRVLNSWSDRWGDGGFAWLSDAFVSSHYCFDHMVVTASPLAR